MPYYAPIRAVQGRRLKEKANGSVVYYSRLVQLLKHALWLLVALTMVALVWVTMRNSGDGGSRIVFSSSQIPADAVQDVMLKPFYQGLDRNNQPFTLSANTATQKDANTVILDNVNADVLQNDSRWMALQAATGEYNREKQSLYLSGGVSLYADGGFEFRAKFAEVNLEEGTAQGVTPVEGQGPPGTLTADSFWANSKDNILRFNGSVRMILYP